MINSIKCCFRKTGLNHFTDFPVLPAAGSALAIKSKTKGRPSPCPKSKPKKQKSVQLTGGRASAASNPKKGKYDDEIAALENRLEQTGVLKQMELT